MKWLFFLLVLLNVSAVTWYSLGALSYEVDDDPVYAPPASERVLLLTEMPEPAEKEQKSFDAELTDSLENELDALAQVSEVVSLPEKLLCPIVFFEKDQEKSEVLAKLQSKGIITKEYRSNGERQKYWVYISAPNQREKAIKIVDDLKSKGIDSFIINRGEMKNRISLGLYSTQVTASAEVKRIARLSGLRVKVFEHLRNVPLSVIEFDKGVTEKEWESLVSMLNLNKMMIKLEKNSC